MDLSIYDIVKGPVLTDKAYKLNKTLQQLVVEVHMHANKVLVKQAIERLFDVKVDKVRISIRKGKKRLAANRKKAIFGSAKKKAIVVLKEGYNIDSLGGHENAADYATVSPEVAAQSTSKDQG